MYNYNNLLLATGSYTGEMVRAFLNETLTDIVMKGQRIIHSGFPLGLLQLDSKLAPLLAKDTFTIFRLPSSLLNIEISCKDYT